MSQTVSVMASVNVEEECDEEDQEVRDQCRTKEAMSSKEKRNRRLEFKAVQGSREVPCLDGVNKTKIEKTFQ